MDTLRLFAYPLTSSTHDYSPPAKTQNLLKEMNLTASFFTQFAPVGRKSSGRSFTFLCGCGIPPPDHGKTPSARARVMEARFPEVLGELEIRPELINPIIASYSNREGRYRLTIIDDRSRIVLELFPDSKEGGIIARSPIIANSGSTTCFAGEDIETALIPSTNPAEDLLRLQRFLSTNIPKLQITKKTRILRHHGHQPSIRLIPPYKEADLPPEIRELEDHEKNHEDLVTIHSRHRKP